MVLDDQDEKTSRPGRDVLVRDGFGAESPGTIRRKYPNATYCMKAYISHKIHHAFNFADFRFVKQELCVILCDKKQINETGLMANKLS